MEKRGDYLKVFIDGDSSPVLQIVENICKENKIDLVIVKNYNHDISSDYAEVLNVDNDKEAADIKIMNLVNKGDIVVSQDYGLAAMVLGKGAYVINQNGKIINQNNVDFLLNRRYINQKAMLESRIYPKFKKRSSNDEKHFKESFLKLIKK